MTLVIPSWSNNISILNIEFTLDLVHRSESFRTKHREVLRDSQLKCFLVQMTKFRLRSTMLTGLSSTILLWAQPVHFWTNRNSASTLNSSLWLVSGVIPPCMNNNKLWVVSLLWICQGLVVAQSRTWRMSLVLILNILNTVRYGPPNRNLGLEWSGRLSTVDRRWMWLQIPKISTK